MSVRSEFPHEVRVTEHEWIELTDGTRLCARIWLPVSASTEPVPAVLEYLPYRKSDGTAWQDSTRHAYFAGHGFASVRVDVRGTGDSDGIIADEYSEAELADGLEVLRWIANRPWCSGRVGVIGYSWGGINGLQLAAMRPPELAAVITLYSTDDRFADDCHYKGGIVLGSDMLPWASTMYAYDARPPDPDVVGERWRDMWLERLRSTPPFIEAWLAHQTRDEYWRRGSVSEDYAAIEVPVLAVGGLADPYTNTVGRLLEHLPGTVRGIIGPWGHVFPERGVPGPAIGFLQECVAWWDRWLRPAEKHGAAPAAGLDPLLRVWMPDWTPPSRTITEKPGRWLELDRWPLDGPESRFDFALDAPRPVPYDLACGRSSGAWCPNGLAGELPDEQSADDARSLVFDTEPLAVRVELLGVARVRFTLAADRARGSLVVRLCDVDPAGASALVTWHQQRVELDEQAVATGAPVALAMDLDLCAHAFAPGHRVRVAISGAYWPHAWPEPRPASFTVHACTLALPRAEDPHVREVSEPFGPPEYATPLPRAARKSAHEHRSEMVGDEVRVIASTDACERFPDGRGHAFARTDRYTVTRDAPLTARVTCERTARVFSRGWEVRVETRSEMWGEGDVFVVDNSIEAFEGEKSLYRDARRMEVPRRDR